MATYIIEHLEPKLWKWSMIEYKQISKTVGKNNLWFTNIRQKNKEVSELKKYGKVFDKSVKNMNLKNACVLDPEAGKVLTPGEAKTFDYFIFGGILGDYPPKKRTKSELTKFVKNAEARNIGKKQFSTDNAVYVTKQIVEGKNFKELKFKNKITIKINEVESVDLPYLYPIADGMPQISPDIIEYLKRKKGF